MSENALWVIFTVIVGIGFDELKKWFPRFAQLILADAVKRAPVDDRERLREEWAEVFAQLPGEISPLYHALTLWWAFGRATVFQRVTGVAARAYIRSVDFAFCLFCLVMLLPVIAVCAGLVFVSSGGSVLVRHRAFGRNFKEFNVLVFDVHNSKSGQLTRVGIFLRKTGLNLLPSLVNVVRGDMSFVGPLLRYKSIDQGILYSGQSFLRPGMGTALQPGEEEAGFGRSFLATASIYVRAVIRAVFFPPVA